MGKIHEDLCFHVNFYVRVCCYFNGGMNRELTLTLSGVVYTKNYTCGQHTPTAYVQIC